MDTADIPEFSWRIRELAAAFRGWYYDEGTPGAFLPGLMRFSKVIVWEAIDQAKVKFPERPTARDMVDLAQEILHKREQAAKYRAPEYQLPAPALPPEPSSECRAKGEAVRLTHDRLRKEHPDWSPLKVVMAALDANGIEGMLKPMAAAGWSPTKTTDECLARIAGETAARKAAKG